MHGSFPGQRIYSNLYSHDSLVYEMMHVKGDDK